MFIRTTKQERKMLWKSGLWFPRPFLFLHVAELEKHHAHAHEQHGAEYDETRARAIMRLVWEKKRRGVKGFWGLVSILIALTALSVQSNGQNAGPFGALNPSHITTITFQNSSGTVLKTFAAPWVFKCSTNMTCAISGNVVTVSSAAGAGGSGYSIIQNGGAAIAAEGAINFLGSFSCVDNPGNTSSDCKLSASAAVSHQFVTGVDASGNYLRAQPLYSDISGTPQLAVTKTCTGTDKVSAYDSTTGLFVCSTDQTGAGGSTPTGTGFTHITAGAQDGAAKTVDVSSSDITGVLATAAQPAHTGDATNSAGSLAMTVGKVNGVAYASGPATDTTPVITAANTATYSALPTCTDTVGKHLNYDTSTHTYSCGTSILANSEIPLGCATNGATPGLTIGPLTIAANKLLRIPVYISSYAGGGSTALMTFNGAGGTAYRFRWLTAAAAATTFTAGASNPPTVSTAGIRLGADNTTLSRNNVVFITNDPANVEKLVVMEAVIGSGSAATQAALTFGNGAWVSGAATSITTVTLTAGTNMGAGSGFCVFGSTF